MIFMKRKKSTAVSPTESVCHRLAHCWQNAIIMTTTATINT